MEVNKEVNKRMLRCKTSTDASKLAGSIHTIYQEDPTSPIAIRVIGAGALNQAVKAVIISNKFFAKKGLVVDIRPSFQDTGDNATAIELKVLFNRN